MSDDSHNGAGLQRAATFGALVSAPVYTSSSGDRWRLICDEAAGRVLVRHEANAASGGHVTEIEVQEFLRMSPASPERDAVLAMLEAAAKKFIPENGGGAGVRMKAPGG